MALTEAADQPSAAMVTDIPAHPPAPPISPDNGMDTPAPRARFAGVPLSPLGWALLPGATYVAARLIGLLALSWMARRNRVGVSSALTAWDGQWYLHIAALGYDRVPLNLVDAFGRRGPETPLAFFPAYPALIDWLSWVPGINLVAGALAISSVSGLLAAYGMAATASTLARRGALPGVNPERARWAGVVFAGLFGASPMAIVLIMTYSEALFCALAAWSLAFLVQRRWSACGICCLFAGLVRPTAGALVLTIVIAGGVAIARRQQGWRPCVAVLLAPLGLLGYLGYVGYRTGRPDGWFELQQRGWDSRFDGGAATWRFTLDILSNGRSVLETSTVFLLIGAVALLVVGVVMRLHWPLLVYGGAVLLMDIGSNGLMNSKARLLLPAFTLLLPLVVLLLRRRRGTVITTLVCATLFSAWFGAHSIVAWQYAI